MRMFKNKKGVSEVVANVLIVLLVIVGVAVIWSVVKPTIDKSAKEINTECFNVKVSPVSCAVDGSAGVVKRDAGAGGFQGFKVIYENAAGETQVFEHLGVVSELATGNFDDSAALPASFVVDNMNVAAIVGPNTADLRTCDVLTAPVSCV